MTVASLTEKISKRALLWPVLVAGTIFLASSRSQIAAPSLEGSDKVVHFAVYGLLATLVTRLRHGGKAAVISVLLVSAYGASDEWHQGFTPGRSVEFNDWLADTLGGALAVVLYAYWPWYRRLLERPLMSSQRRIENDVSVATVSLR
jgi:VanZ family protein